MIRNPRQLHLMRMGLPATPANRSDSSSSSDSTTNNYADKRNAVQGGVGVSGDNNMVFNSSTTTDYGAIQNALNAMVGATQAATYNNSVVSAGAIQGNTDVAKAAINGNSGVASTAITSTVAASNHLEDVGLSMLQANTALANSLMGGVQQSTQAVTGIASQLAQTQIASQNDNRYLIAAGLAVVCIVGVMAFNHKA
ncbi:hypothetical protein AWB76_04078 [Caballeronia temeraria]|uniref:Methyl-accepting chemotaxis protein n=1 Tax=Caballeronia temeraria TaxID=1777137 RepID=A0A158BDW3_9BURK|nr:hypothetical protein [Caballeronia temeraria]SAK68264.1 hypothetical protein AWB76_04078 [Caballeronia temeraria]